MDELENQNNELKQSLNESEEKVKTLKQSLDDAIIQLENKDMEIKSLTESKCYLEKCIIGS
jgi:S-adenosylhomocysteine hydrolase